MPRAVVTVIKASGFKLLFTNICYIDSSSHMEYLYLEGEKDEQRTKLEVGDKIEINIVEKEALVGV